MAGGEQETSHDQEKTTWQYQQEGSAAPLATAASAGGQVKAPDDASKTVEWTASEFVAHQKSALWYLALAAFMLVVSAALYLLTRDLIPAAVVIVLSSLLGVTAARKPRLMAYRLDRGGLTIGRQFYPYGKFKSFAVVDEGAFASITFLPLKRLNLPQNIYFSPEDEHRIMDVLSKYLPMQPGKLDSVDQLMRSLHF